MDIPIDKIASEIEDLKAIAQRLDEISDQLPALNRNIKRIQASIKMLEINFVDPITS